MSEQRRVQIVDAFTDEPGAGNPAGVVPEAAGLTDDQMGTIAAELGASETAFVRPSDVADRKLRFFTPETEVDLCGHATVAAFGSLFDRAAVTAGSYTVETNAGVLDVEIEDDGTVWLTQSPPEVRAADVSLERTADALGLDLPALAEVGEDLPIARASTGLPFLVVPVGYFEQLSAIDPDLAAVEELCEAVDAEGLYAFTFDTLESGATLHGRAFVPLAGIDEDPVTGTASAAVGAYLRQYGALDEADPLLFEQGHFLDRPGRVLVRSAGGSSGGLSGDSSDGDAETADGATPDVEAESDDDAVSDDRAVSDDPAVSDGQSESDGQSATPAPAVGGRTVTVLDGDLTIPPADDDDIIEA